MKRLIRKLLERRLPTATTSTSISVPVMSCGISRMCIVPTRIFDAISDGRVSLVTDEVETFTGTGLALVPGAELEADLIVTATGLNMVPFGGIQLTIDGSDIELPKALAYLGMLLSDVPDMAFAFGYTNQSWTLRADLTCQEVYRLLNHMDQHGYRQCTHRVSRIGRSLPRRSPTSPRGTCCERSTRSRGKSRGTRRSGGKTVPATGDRCRHAPVDDPALELSRAASTGDATTPIAV